MIPDTPAFIETPTSDMEGLKLKCLASLYQNRPAGTLRCYHAVLELARTKIRIQAKGRSQSLPPGLTETDEKHLRQVQEAVKKIYLLTESGTHALPAPFRDIYTALQLLLRDRARQHQPWHLDYDIWAENLDLAPWQTDLLFQTAVIFQLTSGCSNFCRRCNEWALPRIRGHFSREAAGRILTALMDRNNDDLALYGGSDPLDWEDGSTTLTDLLSTYGQGGRFSLLTKVPRGRQNRLRTLLDSGIDLAVSLTHRNRDRIQAFEHETNRVLTKQHATPDLLIPACLDEDFDSVKPSITDSYGSEISPDGAFVIIPTFTSALYPFGHKKIPVTRSTEWFPVKKLGRPALLQDYFKPLQVIGRDGQAVYLDHLLDVQVENILLDNGDYDLTPPGMRSVKEYFEVFEEKARLKRRANTLSVIKRLKKEGLSSQAYRDLSPAQTAAYRSRISAHLDFTRKEKVLAARQSAAAFFLDAILDYVRANPVKTQIIAHLTRKEYQSLAKTWGTETRLFADYADPAADAWQLFRHQVLNLVHREETAGITSLVTRCPAAYDPGRDLFIRS